MPTDRRVTLLLGLFLTLIGSLALMREITRAQHPPFVSEPIITPVVDIPPPILRPTPTRAGSADQRDHNPSKPIIIPVADILQPRGVAFDDAGNLFTISRDNGIIYKITPAGDRSVIADLPDSDQGYVGPLFDHMTGNLLVAGNLRQSGSQVLQITPAGAVSVFAEPLPSPGGMALDANGNLYVALYSCPGTVAKVTRAGSISTFATNLCNPDGLAFGPDGDLFIGNRGSSQVMRVPSSGGEAVAFASGFINPIDIEFDQTGRLFVTNADTGTIAVVDSAGTVRSFVGGLSSPVGLVFDQQNQLYIADYSANSIIKLQDDSAAKLR